MSPLKFHSVYKCKLCLLERCHLLVCLFPNKPNFVATQFNLTNFPFPLYTYFVCLLSYRWRDRRGKSSGRHASRSGHGHKERVGRALLQPQVCEYILLSNVFDCN